MMIKQTKTTNAINKSKIKKATNGIVKIKKIKNKENIKQEKVTNKTLEKHRRQILDQAKKFKYPLQYEKHKLLINTVIVVLISFMVFSGTIYWSLYQSNRTNNFLFKLTQIIPMPVGYIEDEKILYEDYLAYYRSSIYYYENEQIKHKDDKINTIKKRYKERAFENAAKMAYAKKIAQENNIMVTKKEIKEETLDKRIYVDGILSKKSFDNVIKKYYNLNDNEYKKIFIEYPLLLKKVSLFVDTKAKNDLDELTQFTSQPDADFKKIAYKMGDKVQFRDSGEVKYYNNDGGITKAASKLKVNEISKPIISRTLDGYSVVKLISKNKEKLRYQELRINLTEFNNNISKKINNHDYKSYIKIK